MLLQFGSEHVVIDDQSTTVAVKGGIAEHIQVSVQRPNFKGTKAEDFTAKTKAEFKQAATLIVGASNLYKDTTPYWSRPFSMSWKVGQIQREDGLARVPLAKVEAGLRRSGTHGMMIDMTGDTRDMYEFYNLPATTTLSQARDKASALKDLAFGVTVRRNGFAMRI